MKSFQRGLSAAHEDPSTRCTYCLRAFVDPSIIFTSWLFHHASELRHSGDKSADVPVEYFVSVADHDRHLLHVSIRYHSRQAMMFPMPVWNALYQVRNFAQFVTNLTARDSQGHSLPVTALDKTSWSVAPSDGCAVVEYLDYADVAGPFSAQANEEHVFVNWAQVLMYAPSQRDARHDAHRFGCAGPVDVARFGSFR